MNRSKKCVLLCFSKNLLTCPRINNRLKNIIKFKSKKFDSDNAEIGRRSWFTVPYVPTISEKFNKVNSDDIILRYRFIVLTNYGN